LLFHFTGEPDFITPYGITQSAEATEIYGKSMERSFAAVSELIGMGVSEEDAFYLLPNAVSVRMVSTGDLQSLWHKWKLRSCYNAQEEIFRATIQEIEQVQERFPLLGKHLKAPCYVRMRAGVTPFCPEGDHYCGLPVWKYEISQYSRKSL
jgi:thymidylate synthase ThyX